MEYMDTGSLETLYKRGGPIPEVVVGKITISVLKGLIYLFETHRILHRGRSLSWLLRTVIDCLQISSRQIFWSTPRVRLNYVILALAIS